MDEKKDNKKKRTNLKNKKSVTKALSKTSDTKNKKTPTKKTKKDTTKKVVIKEEVKKVNSTNTKKEVEVKKKALKDNKIKSDKVKTKTTSTKKAKTTKKQKETNKLVLPKEWQAIKGKSSKGKEPKTNEKLSGRLKNSIFEELDEKTYLIQKKQQKESLKKTFLTLLIIAVAIALGVYLFFRFNSHAKEQLRMYDKYSIGDKVVLKDDSIWYVVIDSGSGEANVKLLSAVVIDVDESGKIDAKDRKKYNNTNTDVFDLKDENSLAYYLDNDYRPKLENKVGKIKDISLLTSKEFVKMREKMGFGYEWSTGNWLASPSLGTWWIISSQNEKIYAVNSKGTYSLFKATSLNYVRPVITINKESTTKVKDSNGEEKNFFKDINKLLEIENKD